MPFITTTDGTNIFYKDWGPRDGQPIVFHHGWPLSADDWDNQMLFFLAHGYRVIAHDRRGHGRSSQTATGHEMDTYAADVAALTDALDLKGAFHIGHSTGGGEVAHYVARAKPGRVAKAVLVGAVPPIMVKSASQSRRPADRGLRRPARGARGQSRAVLHRPADWSVLRLQPARREDLAGADRQLVASGDDGRGQRPLRVHQGVLRDRLQRRPARRSTCRSSSRTAPTIRSCRIADSAPLAVKLLKKGTLKTYEGLPHGMLSTHPDVVNPDILAFLKG